MVLSTFQLYADGIVLRDRFRPYLAEGDDGVGTVQLRQDEARHVLCALAQAARAGT